MVRTRNTDVGKLEKLAEIMRVISHPVRLEALCLLEENEPLSVVQINGRIPVEQSLLSHRLTKMKDRGELISKGKERTSIPAGFEAYHPDLRLHAKAGTWDNSQIHSSKKLKNGRLHS